MFMKLNYQQEIVGKAKFGLLAEGARIEESFKKQLLERNLIIRTRSGVSGGLDVYLPGDVAVNIPVSESYAADSGYEIKHQDGQIFITKSGADPIVAELVAEPDYYARKSADNSVELKRIGQMCSSDRFCYGMTGASCFFWKEERRCKYCSIGNNYDSDAAKKQEKHLLEALRAAVDDPKVPARHILIGGGTPPGDDMGANLAARLTEAIKREFDISVYVMIAAPKEDQSIIDLKNAGVDELGINLEFWSEFGWQFIPGKRDIIGRSRYLDALAKTAEVFGPIASRSILIAGVEPADETLNAVNFLSEMGVMPIISPFRPLESTLMENLRGFSGDQYWNLWVEAEQTCSKNNLPLGPTCKACQNNVLALPYSKFCNFY